MDGSTLIIQTIPFDPAGPGNRKCVLSVLVHFVIDTADITHSNSFNRQPKKRDASLLLPLIAIQKSLATIRSDFQLHPTMKRSNSIPMDDQDDNRSSSEQSDTAEVPRSEKKSKMRFKLSRQMRRLLRAILKNNEGPNDTSLSDRAKILVNSVDPAYDVFYEMMRNKYTRQNTTGNINLCASENVIGHDLLKQRFEDHPELFVPKFQHLAHYGPPGGFMDVKEKLCEYLRDQYNADVEPGRLVLTSSGNATYDMLAHCLFDEDDIILTNSPTYTRSFVSVAERANCELKPVPLDPTAPRISIPDFEESFKHYTEKGRNVRAVILINPNNPLGIVFPKEDIKKLAEWAATRNLWLIVDEIFSQCVHDDEVDFESFLQYQMTLPTKSLWFWNLSKDFGLPGTKVSLCYTNDRDLHEALCHMELTEPVSALAQDFIVNFLSDRAWLDMFKMEKTKRLRAHYEFVTSNLTELGIPFLKGTGGIFVFVNFSQKLRSLTMEAEKVFWRSLADIGVFMTPGADTKCPLPGCMRLVFACDKEELREGFRRLHKFFNSDRQDVAPIEY